MIPNRNGTSRTARLTRTVAMQPTCSLLFLQLVVLFSCAAAAAGGRFDQIDANNDGVLSVHEIAVAVNKSEDQIRWWIQHQHADTDGSGDISPSEAPALVPHKDGSRFDFVDANGDGRLSIKEIAQATGETEEQKLDTNCVISCVLCAFWQAGRSNRSVGGSSTRTQTAMTTGTSLVTRCHSYVPVAK